jgi:phosphoglycerate kinase
MGRRFLFGDIMQTLETLSVQDRRVLCRVDFNTPLDANKAEVADDLRIRAALPTLKFLLEKGARLILMSHLGRPKGKVNPDFSLEPVRRRLETLLELPVKLAPDCTSEETKSLCDNLKAGEVLLLENLRFHPGETANDPEFVAALAALGDVYVNDAFGTAHRAHASTEGVPRLLGGGAPGFLMQKELRFLIDGLKDAKRPLLAVLGGAKVSGKIDVLTHLADEVDAVIVGGGMMFTFYKALGLEIGSSLLEEDRIEMATELIALYKRKGVELLLPNDVLVADRFAPDAETRVVSRDDIPAGWIGVDIGPDSLKQFETVIAKAGTILWNGPMGVFEIEAFAAGTKGLASAMCRATEGGALSIVGGGDSAAAVKQFGLDGGFSHVSTGGGASLEILEGKQLPGVVALEA